MNQQLAKYLVDLFLKIGVRNCCVCPGSRNAPFLPHLKECKDISLYYWYEERSAAFFALGRSKLTAAPTAIITTSGTAAGELFPAAMEGYYSGIPLLLVTADRPRRFRGSGAPQTAEQVGLFGVYTPWSEDIAAGELSTLESWNQKTPAHLNVCFEETNPKAELSPIPPQTDFLKHLNFSDFLERTQFPFVIVGGLPSHDKEAVISFLIKLNAPVYLEGTSGLREETRLNHLKIYNPSNLWNTAKEADYPIDGVLRIGTIPTVRIWRDIESKEGSVSVCSISHLAFSGLSWGGEAYPHLPTIDHSYPGKHSSLITINHYKQRCLEKLLEQYSLSEPGLFHTLSKRIPRDAFIYVGNSLPIREWDLAATYEERGFSLAASRGVNGIDGQLSTFFGMCQTGRSNWVILGDLTTLYDMAAPWILNSLKNKEIHIVVINNHGGKIFQRMFSDGDMQNCHELEFKKFAEFWGIAYTKWTEIPDAIPQGNVQLIEICPDPAQTDQFWEEHQSLALKEPTVSVL